MTKTQATEDMIVAVRSVHASERLSAMKLAERVFFSCLASPSFSEEFSSDQERREAAGMAAAAEVAYRFA